MANHKNTLKAIRRTKGVTERNTAIRSRVRTYLKQADKAIENGNKDKAKLAVREAEIEIKRAVTKGIYKLSTASRKISRLSQKAKALGAK